jgi:hypothetical protein
MALDPGNPQTPASSLPTHLDSRTTSRMDVESVLTRVRIPVSRTQPQNALPGVEYRIGFQELRSLLAHVGGLYTHGDVAVSQLGEFDSVFGVRVFSLQYFRSRVSKNMRIENDEIFGHFLDRFRKRNCSARKCHEIQGTWKNNVMKYSCLSKLSKNVQ